MAEVIYAGDGGLYKVCTKCDAVLASTQFVRDKNRPFMLSCDCRRCRSRLAATYYEANKLSIATKQKERRESDIDASRAYEAEKRARSRDRTRDASRRHYAKNKDALLAAGRARYAQNKASVISRTKEYQKRNAEATAERVRKWRAANPDKVRDRRIRWAAKDPSKAKELARQAAIRRRATPKGKLENAIRGGIKRGIVDGSKAGRRTFELLGYSAEQLRLHIERQFQPGMSWDNYGRDGWHIDHRLPLSSFNYDAPDDADFRAAWSLTNLQPLWAADNHKKKDKVLFLL